MPILHVQFSAGPVPPVAGLIEHGPVIEVTVGLLEVMAQQLIQQGAPVPAPVAGRALIDTGAFATSIDEAVAQQLGLPVIDTVQISSASHAATIQNVYPALIEVQGTDISINAPRAIGAPLAASGIVALIGRDILQYCTLIYNGTIGSFTLAV